MKVRGNRREMSMGCSGGREIYLPRQNVLHFICCLIGSEFNLYDLSFNLSFFLYCQSECIMT